jgi:hypothetical protein
MKDEKPPLIKEDLLPPPSLNPKQQELCRRLDDFYKKNKFKPLRPKPSDIFAGAIYGIQSRLRSNPDWMSQVANSLRELLYPIWYEVRRLQNRAELIKDKFKKYGSVFIEDVFDEVEEVYGKLNDLAHHGVEPKKFSENDLQNFTESDFEKLIRRFEDLMFQSLTLTLDVFEQIDQLLLRKPDEHDNLERLREEIRKLIKEKSSKEYFFYKADEQWLDWLWENGFLDAIKQKSKDPTRYGYQMPELNYLVRIAEKRPKKVADIIIAVPISQETFNPEVIDQFLHICEVLPAEQLARIVPKIHDDGWAKLMSVFNIWGFEFEKIFQVLATARDYRSFLTLAEAVLAVRTKEEIKQISKGFSSNNPFYFSDISYTKVFEHLREVDDKNAEKALELTTKVLGEIVCLGEKAERSEVFPIRDTFYLFNIDFFSLNPSKEAHLPNRENVRELAATIKTLAQRLIEKKCHETELTHEIYKKYIVSLPESRLIWRLRLFILSLCPKTFKEELKQSFSRLFEVMEAGKPYYEIESGTEYKKALKKSFGFFDSNYQRGYVKNVFKYFAPSLEDKEKEQWYKQDGWEILSSIFEHLTEDERDRCEKIFGKKCDPSFKPEPSIEKIEGGYVRPRGPITQDEFERLPVVEISDKLRSEWAPEALQKQRTAYDFLNPLNAEGVGDLLRADIAKRLQDYIQNACLFFERGVLDEHYTYSFFRGIQEALRADKSGGLNIQWDNLIELFIKIKNSGKEKTFNRQAREYDTFGAWLSSWTGVHISMTDVLQELLNERDGKIVIDFFKYRNQLFAVIGYLLGHPDPEPKDEQLETAAAKIHLPDDKEDLVSDPFTIAINSVRGRAFQAFVLVVYQDGKKFLKDNDIKISADAKKLYETVLEKENTRALMFMFGHYLPTFFYRDKEWIRKLLPQIFPKAPDKKHLYLAAWEGYLANNLYREIFIDPAFQELYERGLDLTDIKDSHRKYFKNPDEGIGIHLALAFMYYEDFGFNNPLFKIFWQSNNIEQHAAFVSFLGRMFISGKNARADELLEKEPRSKKTLKELWDWLLENYKNRRSFIEFGFWISLEKDIFEPTWLAEHVKKTLEKTNGVLDWDYGLAHSILEMAKNSPKDTLEIVRLYLLEGGVRGRRMRRPFLYDDKWVEAIKILYGHSETRAGTYAIINDLIREGGSVFWNLKDIFGDDEV